MTGSLTKRLVHVHMYVNFLWVHTSTRWCNDVTRATENAFRKGTCGTHTSISGQWLKGMDIPDWHFSTKQEGLPQNSALANSGNFQVLSYTVALVKGLMKVRLPKFIMLFE